MDNKLLSIEIGGYNAFSDYKTEDTFRLQNVISELQNELAIERRLRYDAEQEVNRLRIQVIEASKKRKRRTKAEMEESQVPYCEFKSDGKKKAAPAEPIRSYSDFVSIQKYFLDKNKVRDWALWTIGVSLGLRISDLLNLKFHNFLTENNAFRDRLRIIEKKTAKLNNCLITESVKNAITKYLDSIKWDFTQDDYLFKSHKTKNKMNEEQGWRIISDAGKALGLPVHIGSHTMRKSFANIAACVDKSCVDMNSITKVQGLLNHSDQRVTMRYLGTFQDMFDRARIAVSDFVLGKTEVDELVAGNNYTIDDIFAKLDKIETKIKSA